MCMPALDFILSDLELLKCTHESHEQRAGGVRESDNAWNSKRAAAYPAQLNIILAQPWRASLLLHTLTTNHPYTSSHLQLLHLWLHQRRRRRCHIYHHRRYR